MEIGALNGFLEKYGNRAGKGHFPVHQHHFGKPVVHLGESGVVIETALLLLPEFECVDILGLGHFREGGQQRAGLLFRTHGAQQRLDLAFIQDWFTHYWATKSEKNMFFTGSPPTNELMR